MNINLSKPKIIFNCLIFSSGTLSFWFFSVLLLIDSSYKGSLIFFGFGLTFLLFPYFFYRSLKVSIEFSNDGIKSNKLNKLGFDGVINWNNIKSASYGTRRGIDYIDININPDYVRKGLGASKDRPDCLFERNLRLFTEALSVKNKDIALFINQKVNHRNIKDNSFEFYSFLDKLENIL